MIFIERKARELLQSGVSERRCFGARVFDDRLINVIFSITRELLQRLDSGKGVVLVIEVHFGLPSELLMVFSIPRYVIIFPFFFISSICKPSTINHPFTSNI